MFNWSHSETSVHLGPETTKLIIEALTDLQQNTMAMSRYRLGTTTEADVNKVCKLQDIINIFKGAK